QRSRRPASRIAQERVPKHGQRAPMLQGQTRGKCRISSIGIALRAYLVIANKNFADAAVCKTRDGRGVTESVNLKIERFRRAPVWQALAREDGLGSVTPAFFP